MDDGSLKDDLFCFSSVRFFFVSSHCENCISNMKALSLSDFSENIQKHFINHNILSKGKRGQIGEIRTWKNGKWIKTIQGWIPFIDKKEKKGDIDIEAKKVYIYDDQLKDISIEKFHTFVKEIKQREDFLVDIPNLTGSAFKKVRESYENLTFDEFVALQSYVGSSYFDINDLLYNEDGSELKIVKDLRSALDKIPKFTGVVYRGTGLYDESPASFRRRMKVGSDITMKGFISSTASKNIANRILFNKGILYTIKSKNGANLREIHSIEEEVLFKNNSKFKVLEFHEKEINGRPIFDIMLEEVD